MSSDGPLRRSVPLLYAALLALAAAVVLATVLPFVRGPYWWARMFDFPRAQIAVVAAVAFAGLLAVDCLWADPTPWGTAALVALGLAAAYQAARMLPYSRLWRAQTPRAHAPDRARSLRLVVSNVLMTNRDRDRWLRAVRAARPDVVAAVETDAWWAETAAELAESLPHRVEVPQDDTYGMLVRSRLPITDAQVRHLVEPEVPSLWLTLALPSGEPLRLVVLHPRPPRPDVRQDSTLRDAELVLAARDIDAAAMPTVVCGDLNDVAWSRTTRLFQKLAGVLDPRVGRGLFATFHADHAWLRYPLDHVFHSPDLALVDLCRLGHVGSDHFPICVELALNAPGPHDAPDAEAPDADAADRAEAREAVQTAEQALSEETPAERRERIEQDV